MMQEKERGEAGGGEGEGGRTKALRGFMQPPEKKPPKRMRVKSEKPTESGAKRPMEFASVATPAVAKVTNTRTKVRKISMNTAWTVVVV